MEVRLNADIHSTLKCPSRYGISVILRRRIDHLDKTYSADDPAGAERGNRLRNSVNGIEAN